ncbi:MAG: hypothetical protein JST59_27085 [Actinobacteria bacterium]|nr:hypothetical protein [Actinomycetota bacterium]
MTAAIFAHSTALAATASAAGERGPLAEQTLLRLSELPGGYVVRPGGYCEPVEVHSYTGKKALEAWVKAFSPFDCHLGYRRLYRPTGAAASPPSVATASVTTSGLEAAEAARPVLAEMVENLTEARRARTIPTAGTIGDETRVFRSPELDGDYRPESLPGVTVVWRDGSALEFAYAGGWSYTEDERAAYALAAKQQAHVEAPSPYLASEAEDIPTYFENPALKLPTYWLGRTFAPGKGLETSYFGSVLTRAEAGHPHPGLEGIVEYAPALSLDSWTPRGWTRFAKSSDRPRSWNWACTYSRQVSVPRGHATIYAAFGKDFASCPGSPPRHLSAVVHLPGVVVTIGVATCAWCESGTLSYESVPGMEAVIRGLRRWQPGEEEAVS